MLGAIKTWRSARHLAAAAAAVAGLATAALVGVAVAKSFTLSVAHNATVTDANSGATSHENILVDAHGRAVYTLTGDSKQHQECIKASGCFGVWPPVTVSSVRKLSKAPGVKGRLRVWHRSGLVQVTLSGHPLYTYAGDSQKRVATGEAINSFHGIWHVVTTGSSHGTNTPSTDTTMPSTTTSPAPCAYPPCYP